MTHLTLKEKFALVDWPIYEQNRVGSAVQKPSTQDMWMIFLRHSQFVGILRTVLPRDFENFDEGNRRHDMGAGMEDKAVDCFSKKAENVRITENGYNEKETDIIRWMRGWIVILMVVYGVICLLIYIMWGWIIFWSATAQ